MSKTAAPLVLVLGSFLALMLALSPTPLRAEESKKGAADSVFTQRKGGRMAAKGKLAKPAPIRLGRGIAGTAKPRITDWFGRAAVSGQVDVVNTTDKKLHAGVTFVLYDKDGAVLAATSQNQDLDPKEETIWGGFVVQLPKGQLARIASYEYVWYEDSKPIGAR